MKNQKGFIATSLIYSFFLVFVALIAAILSSYLANKTILERTNSEIQEKLNTNTYKLSVISKNARLKEGKVLTNLVSNSNFENNNFWNTPNATYSLLYSFTNSSVQIKHRYSSKGQVNQNINLGSHVEEGDKIYLSLKYMHTASAPAKAYIGPTRGIPIEINRSPSTWISASEIYEVNNSDPNVTLVLGDSDRYYSGITYFSNAMVINLTASFGRGFEPAKDWMDRNIAWFDGTISYFSKDNIKSGESFSVTFDPSNGYKVNDSEICKNEDGTLAHYVWSTNDGAECTIDDENCNVLTVTLGKSNVTCNLNWQEE